MSCSSRVLRLGLSPRERGKRRPRCPVLSKRRTIPAWAGEPFAFFACRVVRGVYPRVGGGTLPLMNSARRSSGLSPRGRGNLPEARRRRRDGGSIPAWAGEPASKQRFTRTQGVYPRVGGGTLPLMNSARRSSGLSPRGRGNLPEARRRRRDGGSIPAWAGEPASKQRFTRTQGVYPRVGGGTWTGAGEERRRWGLSPRGRGNLFRFERVDVIVGSIPAWAGNPHRLLQPERGLGSIPAWAGEPDRRASAAVRQPVYPRVGGGTTVGRSTTIEG